MLDHLNAYDWRAMAGESIAEKIDSGEMRARLWRLCGEKAFNPKLFRINRSDGFLLVGITYNTRQRMFFADKLRVAAEGTECFATGIVFDDDGLLRAYGEVQIPTAEHPRPNPEENRFHLNEGDDSIAEAFAEAYKAIDLATEIGDEVEQGAPEWDYKR